MSTTNGQETAFGVNLADGRIKSYGLRLRGREKTFFVLSGQQIGVRFESERGSFYVRRG